MRFSRARLVGTAVIAAACIGGIVAASALRSEARARERAARLTGGDPARAPALVRRYGCAGCHRIPGIDAPGGSVGPDLGTIGERVYIAGVRPNTPGDLVAWIADPAAVKPGTAMPVTGIGEQGARDVAAYLLAHAQ